MIDMDDVLTSGNFICYLEEYLGKKIDINQYKFYSLQELLGNKKMDFFNKFKDLNMYQNAVLLPNCYEVLKELNEIYKIYICTAYIWPEIISYAGNNLKDKYQFLYENLDFIDPRNYIFAEDKAIVNCDIKIDDKLENLKNAKLKLLYTAWHNKDLDLEEENLIRVNDWLDIKRALIKKNNTLQKL